MVTKVMTLACLAYSTSRNIADAPPQYGNSNVSLGNVVREDIALPSLFHNSCLLPLQFGARAEQICLNPLVVNGQWHQTVGLIQLVDMAISLVEGAYGRHSDYGESSGGVGGSWGIATAIPVSVVPSSRNIDTPVWYYFLQCCP